MMYFTSRAIMVLTLCVALATMACASDSGEETGQMAEETKSMTTESAEPAVEPAEPAAESDEPVSQQDKNPSEKNRAANAAYDFTLKDTEGSYLRLSEYAGKVVLLNFWDTWCAPCRMEIPDLKELHGRYYDDGFVVIGVALGRNGEQKVRSFVQQFGISYPVVIASREMLSAYGGVGSIPTTFLLNKDQTIHKRYIGLQPKATLEKEIKNLLAQG
jgi:thiol-disulfide isomerase/thioredoxin